MGDPLESLESTSEENVRGASLKSSSDEKKGSLNAMGEADINPTNSSQGGHVRKPQEKAREGGRIITQTEKAFHVVAEPIVHLNQSMVRGGTKAGGELLDVTQSLARDADKVGRELFLPVHKAGKVMLPTIPSMRMKPALKALPLEAGEAEDDQFALPPDETLQSMHVIMRKRLNGVSIRELYECCWSEGNGTDNDEFYGPWCVEDGKLDVNVGDWEFANNGNMFVGDWDKEEYSQKRVVTYRYLRDPNTMGYKMGKPEVLVTQIHYYQNQGDDRSVLSMTVEMDGEVFSDSFKIQIRGVATRVGNNDIAIDFGVFVVFQKQVLIAGKIREISIDETAKTMLDLFGRMKNACGAEEAQREAMEEEDIEAESTPDTCDFLFKQSPRLFSFCFPFLFREKVFKDDIDQVSYEIQEKLRVVLALPAGDSDVDYEQRFVHSEFAVIQDALDRIISRELAAPVPNKDQADVAPTESSYNPLKRATAIFNRWHLMVPTSSLTAPNTRGWIKLAPTNKEATESPPPDDVFKAMNVFLSKTYKGSVEYFYELISSETQLYGPWLAESAKTNIKIGDWERSPVGDSFLEDWSKENFTQRRTISFQYNIPPKVVDELAKEGIPSTRVASVTQAHYCRLEGNEKCVFSFNSKTQGLPFSDCFRIQVRWVVTRVNNDEICIKIGMFVVMIKKTVFSRKISAEATKCVMKQQLDLLAKAEVALGIASGRFSSTNKFDYEETETTNNLHHCMPCKESLIAGSLIAEDEELARQVKVIKAKLRMVNVILEERDPGKCGEDMNFYLSQLVVIRESLDDVIVWHGDHEKGKHHLLAHALVAGLS